MALDLKAFAERVGATARAKGWDAPTRDNIPGKLALVLTEVYEAVATEHVPYRWDPSELADIFIRTIDILGTCFPARILARDDDWSFADSSDDLTNANIASTPKDVVGWYFVTLLARAVESWRRADWFYVGNRLDDILQALYVLATTSGIDLDAALVAKADYNDTRQPLHGKKMTLG